MSDELNLEQFDDGSEGFKSLRKAVEKYKTQTEALLNENATLKAEKAQGALTAGFAKHGIDPKFLSLYTDDDRSDEAIARWGETYGFKQEATPSAEEQSTVPAEEQRVQGVMQQVATATGSDQLSLAQRIKNTSSPAELAALLAEHGAAVR